MYLDEEEVNPAFVCPITNEIFKDPVIAEDGQTYEKDQIVNWLDKNPISPKTRQPMKIQNLRPNNVIKKMIEDFRKCQSESNTIKKKNAEFIEKFQSQIKKVSSSNLEKETMRDWLVNNPNIEAFKCPLTKKIFVDPVFCSDGFTYERKAIQEWLSKNNTSPVLKTPLENKYLVPNYTTKGMIDLVKEENERNWGKAKHEQEKLKNVVVPKINQVLSKQMKIVQNQAALKILSNYGFQNKNNQKMSSKNFQITKQISFYYRSAYVVHKKKMIQTWVSPVQNFFRIYNQKQWEKQKNQIKQQKVDEENKKIIFQENKQIQKAVILKKKIELEVESSRYSNRRPFQIPEICKNYIQREQYQVKIKEVFSSSNIMCVAGFSGCGKTQLVISFLIQNKDKYSEIIWLNCLSFELAMFQLRLYLETCLPQQKFSQKSNEAIIQIFQNYLGKDTVIVLDDAEQQTFQHLKLRKQGIKIIITSKSRNWECPKVDVYSFQMTEGYEYINKAIEKKEAMSSEQSYYVLSFSSGFPETLAEIVACLNTHKQMSINEFLLAYNNKQIKNQGSGSSFTKNIYSSLILIVNKLRKENTMTYPVLNFLAEYGANYFDVYSVERYIRAMDGEIDLSKTKRKKIRKLLNELSQCYILRNIYPGQIKFDPKFCPPLDQKGQVYLIWNTSLIQSIRIICSTEEARQEKQKTFRDYLESSFNWISTQYNRNDEQLKRKDAYLTKLQSFQDIIYGDPQNYHDKIMDLLRIQITLSRQKYYRLVFVTSSMLEIAFQIHYGTYSETMGKFYLRLAWFLDNLNEQQYADQLMKHCLEIIQRCKLENAQVNIQYEHVAKIREMKQRYPLIQYPSYPRHLQITDYEKYNEFIEQIQTDIETIMEYQQEAIILLQNNQNLPRAVKLVEMSFQLQNKNSLFFKQCRQTQQTKGIDQLFDCELGSIITDVCEIQSNQGMMLDCIDNIQITVGKKNHKIHILCLERLRKMLENATEVRSKQYEGLPRTIFEDRTKKNQSLAMKCEKLMFG